jgi:hypothetical protein
MNYFLAFFTAAAFVPDSTFRALNKKQMTSFIPAICVRVSWRSTLVACSDHFVSYSFT